LPARAGAATAPTTSAARNARAINLTLGDTITGPLSVLLFPARTSTAPRPIPDF
jgi:hypothetical protein